MPWFRGWGNRSLPSALGLGAPVFLPILVGGRCPRKPPSQRLACPWEPSLRKAVAEDRARSPPRSHRLPSQTQTGSRLPSTWPTGWTSGWRDRRTGQGVWARPVGLSQMVLATVSLGHIPQDQAGLLHGFGGAVRLPSQPRRGQRGGGGLPRPASSPLLKGLFPDGGWRRLCSLGPGLRSPPVFSPVFQVGAFSPGFLHLYLQPLYYIFHSC